MWWRLAVNEVFGIVLQGPEAESYLRAEKTKEEGEQARREGVGAESKARNALHRGEPEFAVNRYHGATSSYDTATARFNSTHQTLKGIEQRDKK